MIVVLAKSGQFRGVVAELPSGRCSVEYQRRFGEESPWQRTRTVETALPFHATLDLVHNMIDGE